ncbi:unnamed protein product [Ascophyllum nodosum]
MAFGMGLLRSVARSMYPSPCALRRKSRLLVNSLASAASPILGSAPGVADWGVRIWGHGGKGQLGISKEKLPLKETLFGRLSGERATTSPMVLPGYQKSGARTISCGSDYTALVTTKGKLFTFGSNNKKGLLGLGEKEGKGRHEMTEVPALKGVDIATVDCGEQHSVAVDANGTAYSWGSGGSGWDGSGALGLGNVEGLNYIVPVPTEITAMSSVGAKVAKACAGGSHTVFLTTDGEVWTCGRGEYGLCGNGGTDDQLTPSPLETFEDHIIVDVQAGHAFALALTSEGEVFSWGRNDHGQLGLGGGLTMDVYAAEILPRSIDALANEKVVSISAGYNHATAVTDSGKLYMWGMKRSLEPELMSVLEDKRVVSAPCGKWYTAALTDTGGLYTVGLGKSFCLGEGTAGRCRSRRQPAKVRPLGRANVVHVACGISHVAALVKPRPPSPNK